MKKKSCTKCKKEKSISEFYPRGQNQLEAQCKDCKKELDKRKNITKKLGYCPSESKLLLMSEIKIRNDFEYPRTNHRNNDGEAEINNLAADIQLNGLIHPLIVNKEGSEYVLVAGGRRLSALKKLGSTHVPVSVFEKSIDDQELLAISENWERKDLSDYETDRQLVRWKELYEKKYPQTSHGKAKKDENSASLPSFSQEVSTKLAASVRTVQIRVARIKKSSPQVLEAYKNNKIKPSQVNQLIKLSEEEQNKYLAQIIGKGITETKRVLQPNTGTDQSEPDVVPPDSKTPQNKCNRPKGATSGDNLTTKNNDTEHVGNNKPVRATSPEDDNPTDTYSADEAKDKSPSPIDNDSVKDIPEPKNTGNSSDEMDASASHDKEQATEVPDLKTNESVTGNVGLGENNSFPINSIVPLHKVYPLRTIENNVNHWLSMLEEEEFIDFETMMINESGPYNIKMLLSKLRHQLDYLEKDCKAHKEADDARD